MTSTLQVWNYLFELFYLIWLIWHGKHVNFMQINKALFVFTPSIEGGLSVWNFCVCQPGIEVTTAFIPVTHMDINRWVWTVPLQPLIQMHHRTWRPSCLECFFFFFYYFFLTLHENTILSVMMAIIAAWSETLFLRSRKVPLWNKMLWQNSWMDFLAPLNVLISLGCHLSDVICLTCVCLVIRIA